MGERSGEGLAAFNERLAPHIFLHGLFCRDPGAARFAPTGRAGDCFFKAELISQCGRVLEGFLPLRRHVDEAFLDHLRSEQGSVEVLKAAQTCAMHPFLVELDSIFGDVAVHPVPPHAGACAGGRIFESALRTDRLAFCADASVATRERHSAARVEFQPLDMDALPSG